MVEKTDLSREFGLLPDRKEQEYGSRFADLDPKTDPSPEFTHPPDSEFGDAQKHQEFAHNSDTEGTGKKLSRRERHRRTLLLQMAAVGLSAVVVTSSFGQDILGDDMLFTDGGDSSDSYNSFIYAETVIESSKHDEDESLDIDRYLVYGDGESEPNPYGDSIRYDERSNTLYLSGCKIDILQIGHMGDDITVYVEETSCVGLLECYGSDLTIAGNPGATLLVNQHDPHVHWWHGIVLYGQGTDSALIIEPGITVDVDGNGAIAIDNTTATQGIVFNEAYTTLSGGTVQRGYYIFEHGSFVDDGGKPDWTVVDEDGNEAEHVIFSSDGAAYGSLEELWIHVDTDNGSGLLIDGGELTEFGASVADDVYFNLSSSTLRICSDNVQNITASWPLATNFSIYIDQDTTLHSIDVTFRPDSYSAYLVLTGSVGSTLRIFPEDTDSPTPAISLNAMGKNHALNINTGISVCAEGAHGADAIQVINTTDPAGIVFGSHTHCSGSVISGYFGYESEYAENAVDFSVTHGMSSDSDRADYVEFIYIGDYEEPEHPEDPVDPGTSGVSRLSITTTDQNVYQLWLDGESWNPAPSVASYDPDTNTLTIGGTLLEVIEANFMGSDFTIHVAQDASVGTISSVGSNVILSGENTNLTVNNELVHTYGIYIDAFGGNNWLQIDPGLTVESLGQEAGIAIANSWAAPGIVYDPSLTYIYEPIMTGDYGFSTNGPDSDNARDTTVIDEKDPFQGPSTHVYIEGYEIELEPEPPVEEPLLNQYSDLYVTLPDDTTPIYIVENGQVTGNEYQLEGLSYDINTNTLTLSDYTGGNISANVMGDDFTIRLKGENRVGMITGSGNYSIDSCSLTITGDPGASLIINEDSSEMDGIWLTGDCTDTRLTIDEGINVTVYGSYYAIQVTGSTAAEAISVHESLIMEGASTLSATLVQGALVEGAQSWLFLAENGLHSKYVSFRSEQRVGVFVTLSPGDEPVNICDQGQMAVNGTSIEGIVCDTASKTLSLTNFTADRIEICGMGDFDIYLSGDNYIGQIRSDGSLQFGGVAYATLTVNEELLYANGVVIEADGSESSLSVRWGPDIQIYGNEAAAVAVYDSTALDGISLGTYVVLSGYITQGSLAGDSFDPQTGVRSWTVYDTYGTVQPSRHVTISSSHDGGPSDDGRLTISVDGVSTVLFADRLPTADAASLPGISYDHASNTLLLNEATFDHLEVYHMGSGFTIELSGENYGQSIISVGSPNSDDGSIRISGDHFDDELRYGQLYLVSEINPYGILLDANGGSSVLQIDWVDTLSITAPETAIMVRNTTAETGIVVDGYMGTGKVTQQTSDAGTEWVMTDFSTGERLTEVSFHGGYGGGFDNYEHNGIIAFEPPSQDAQRWIYVDTFSPIYVDDPNYSYLETFEGVTYDEATNTLTLNNCDVVNIETVLMGDDFTIELVGDNYVDELIVNASNVTFTGTGSLTVYAAHSGLRLEAQNRPHFIRIEYGVTMKLVSSYSAIRIHASTAEQPLILADGVSISDTLAVGYHNDSCYGVTTDPSVGAANYSFIHAKRSGTEYTEYVHGTDIRITSN